MSAYPHPRNTSVMHASANIESVRPRSNDEARATWAAKYYSRGLHRANGKPRIRVTVPQPLCQPAPQQRTDPPPVAAARAGSSLPSGVSCDREHEHTAGRQFIHSSPCGCVDDAQRHYALIARDLIAAGRDGELTDDMRQAYDYEFGGVPEPEPPQIPEF